MRKVRGALEDYLVAFWREKAHGSRLTSNQNLREHAWTQLLSRQTKHMNGVSLKDLRWFTTFNDEFCESESVSIWQAVLFILPYFDDDASVNYFENIQRMEVKVCEDLIEELDEERESPRRDDKSPNYTHSYTEWDAIGNRLLTEEQIDAFLPELNRSRTLVLEDIEEAENIYQQIKIEIRKSRGNEDTLRGDFERVLIERTSLFEVFPDILPKETKKPINWHDITINIGYREKRNNTQGDTPYELIPHIVFKAGQKILCQGTPKELSFQGQKRNEPNKSFEVLMDFGKPQHERKHRLQKVSDRKAVTDLRKLLNELTEISGDPFYTKQEKNPYEPKFTVKILVSESTEDDLYSDERLFGKSVPYEDGFTGRTQDYTNEYDVTDNMSDYDNEDGVTGNMSDYDDEEINY
jgi:hypothetical protein